MTTRMTTDEQRLERTRWEWTNEYGPQQATALLQAVADLCAADPELGVAAAIARVDPETEEDYDGFCASRW